MNVLSLFDGISCGQQSLLNCGISVNKYYASEIDQRAVNTTQKRWPKTIQYGDVTRIKAHHFMSKIHLLIGGSPCQGFSFAGKQLNFNDPRSRLFFEYVRMKKELNPDFFFLENVRMKKIHQDVISNALGVEPIFVNSSLVSAQVRQRLYWTNIPGFQMPIDRGIYLQDILEFDCKEGFVRDLLPNNIYKIRKVKKSSCLVASYSHGLDNKHARTFIKKVITHSTQPRNGKGQGGKGHLQKEDGKSYCLDTSCTTAVEFDDIYRKLTVTECERLQGLPDNYTKGMSKSAAYHALGNGWQVDTIMEFFKHLPKDL